MPHMKPLAGRVRKFYQCIVLGSGIIVRGLKGLLIVPDSLPFLFHLVMVVRYCHFDSSILSPGGAHCTAVSPCAPAKRFYIIGALFYDI
jgi:hypothetical protein